MGLLTAMEIIPFALFSLPTGVCSIASESCRCTSSASFDRRRSRHRPIAWWLGWLSMPWLYFVGFLIGAVNTTAGSAAQIVLTQIVPRTAPGGGARKERAGLGDRGSDGTRRRGCLDQVDGRADCTVGECVSLADIGIHSARRAGQRNSQQDQSAVLGSHARGPGLCAGPQAARDHGVLRRHLANVQSSATVVQILFRDPSVGTLGARRRIELCCARCRHSVCERKRTSGGQALGSGSNIGIGFCNFRHGLADAGNVRRPTRWGSFAYAPCC